MMDRRRNGPAPIISAQLAVATNTVAVLVAAMLQPPSQVLCLSVQRDKSMTAIHSAYRMAATEGCGEPMRLSWDKRE